MGGNNVRLIVQLQTRSRSLGGVSVRGNSAISEEKILDVADLSERRRAARRGVAVQEARANVQELYRKRGYPEATVSYNITAPERAGLLDRGAFPLMKESGECFAKLNFVGVTVFKES